MTEATQCSIGLAKEEECHKESCTQDVGLIQFNDLVILASDWLN